MRYKPVTVVEHPNYIRRAEKLLTSEQMDDVANIPAADPKAGEVMQATGGFRKLRATPAWKGKARAAECASFTCLP